jgi:plasmid stabilization system protein ParE
VSTFPLSRSADLDLDEIDLRTIELFGFEQAEKLDAAFYKAFHKLADLPQIGHRRSDLDPPGREFLYWTVLRRFLIVYQRSTVAFVSRASLTVHATYVVSCPKVPRIARKTATLESPRLY